MTTFVPQKSPEIVATLHQEIAAIAPIHGISIGDWSDKDTWTVWFKDEATDLQKENVAEFILTTTDGQLAGIN